MADYKAEGEAERAKTVSLRARRLAKEAAGIIEPKAQRPRKRQNNRPRGRTSYSDKTDQRPGIAGSYRTAWWARQDSNLQPDRYERSALTVELRAHWVSTNRAPRYNAGR